jgi:transcriptional regulator with XRE-family HTH domain
MDNVTNRLKELRKQAGLTQQELAERAGTAQSHIANIEKGKRDIDFELAGRLAKALNVKPYELLPLDWQPETITPAEQAILDMIRKTKAPDNTDDSAANKAG